MRRPRDSRVAQTLVATVDERPTASSSLRPDACVRLGYLSVPLIVMTLPSCCGSLVSVAVLLRSRFPVSLVSLPRQDAIVLTPRLSSVMVALP